MKFYRTLLLILFFYIGIFQTAIAQVDYYWVGNTGNWSELNHWATTSGGDIKHVALPSSIDNVILDENSFTLTDQILTMDQSSICNNFDVSRASNSPRIDGTSSLRLDIHGALTLSDSVNLASFIADIRLMSDTQSNLHFGNNRSFNEGTTSWANILFEGDGPFVFTDSVSSGQFYLRNSASLDFNGQYINVLIVDIISNYTGDIDFNGAELETEEFNLRQVNSEAYTFNRGVNSKLSVSRRFQIRDQETNFGDIRIKYDRSAFFSSQIPTVDIIGSSVDSLHFGKLKIDSLLQVNIEPNQILSFTDIEMTGTRSLPITLRSRIIDSPVFISVPSGTINASFLDLKDIHAIGGATFNASNSTDNGGNQGWNITEPTPLNFYWIGNSGNWSDASHWATSSGGNTLHNSIPGRFDHVIFDQNSFERNSSVTVNSSIVNECLNLDFSNIDDNLSFRASNFLAKFQVYGNVSLSQLVDFSNFRTDFTFSANKPVTININKNTTFGTIDENAFIGNGPFVFQDSVFSGRYAISNNAVVDFSNQYVSADNFTIRSNFIGTLNISNAIVELDYLSLESSNDYNLIKDEAEIAIRERISQFATIAKNMGNVTLKNSGNVISILSGRSSGTILFDTLTVEPGVSLVLESNFIFETNQLIAEGVRNNQINITSNEADSEATLFSSEGSITGTYLNLKDVHGSGGAVFTANFSTNNGNTNGWVFTEAPSFNYYWVGGAGSWSEANEHWATTSGGSTFYSTPPSRLDNVFFDANSFAAAGEKIIIDEPASLLNMDWTGTILPVGFSSSDNSIGINVYGKITLNEHLDLSTYNSFINMNSEAEVSVVTGANKSYNSNLSMRFYGTGPFNLQDSTFIPDLRFFDGAVFNANQNYIQANNIVISSTYEGVLDVSNSVIKAGVFTNSSRNTSVFSYLKEGTLTYIDNRISSSTRNFNFGNVTLENTNGSARVSSSGLSGATFDTLTIQKGMTATFDFIASFNIKKLIAEGTPEDPIVMTSSNISSNRVSTINITSGEVNGTYLDLRLIDARGGATFNAYNSTDNGGNVGWNFLTDFDPPNYMAGQPTTGDITGNGLTVTAGLDQVGDVFYVVTDPADNQPNIDQILAGQNGDGNVAIAAGSIDVFKADSVFQEIIQEVTPLRNYKLYLVGVDFVSNVMADSIVVDFSTPRGAQVLELVDTGVLRFGDASFPLQVNSNSGLPVTITSSDPGIISLNGNIATINGLGSTTITLNQTGNSEYFPANETFILTTRKRLLTITAQDQSRTYGSDNPVLSLTYEGFLGNDDVTDLDFVPLPSTNAIISSPVGSYEIDVSVDIDTRYEINAVAGSLTISKASLVVNAGNYSKAYKEILPDVILTYSGFVLGQSVANLNSVPGFTLNADINSDAGDYPVIINNLSADNYSFIVRNGTLSINKITLSASVGNYSKIYGEDNPVFTITYNGFADGEDESFLDVPLSAETSAVNSSNAGNYDIALTGATDINYDFAVTIGVLSVLKAPLTATVEDAIKIYGADNPTFNIIYDGFVNGDTEVSLVNNIPVNTPATINSNVGEYDLTIPPVTDSNYEISSSSAILTVNKRRINITADNQQKQPGSALPEFTITFNGLVNEDDQSVIDLLPEISTTATSLSPQGEYTISLTGGSDNNYELILNNGILQVLDFFPQRISFNTITTANYGDDSFEIQATSSSDLPVSFVSTDLNVLQINENVVTIVSAGTASIIASQVGNNIYQAAEDQEQSILVEKARIIATANNQSRAVQNPNPTLTISYEGFVNDDTTENLDILPEIETTAAFDSETGDYEITLTGGNDDNYSFELINGTLSVIAKETQLISFEEPEEYVYGNSPVTLNASSSSNLPVAFSVLENDVVSLNDGVITILSAGTVSVTAIQEGNNVFASAEPITRNIIVMKAPLVVTADNQTRRVRTANQDLTVNYTGFVNNESVSVLDVTPVISTLATIDSEPGSYEINVSGGVDGNYEFDYRNGTLVIEDLLTQTLSFETIPVMVFGDNDFVLDAQSDAGLAVSFSSSDESVIRINGNQAEIIGAGSVSITASQMGNEDYALATSSQEVIIAKADQQITFNDIDDLNEGEGIVELVAVSNSGLEISFRIITGVAVLENNFINTQAAGLITVEASQNGNANYNAAESVTKSFEVMVINSLAELPHTIFKLYPNPAIDIINIENNNTEKFHLKIIDTNGRTVKESNSNTNQKTLNISGLVNGVYRIIYTNQKGVMIFQSALIKQ